MTTDELVREGIEYLKEQLFGEMPWYMRQFYAGNVGGTVVTRFSVALNDETKDVRYIERVDYYTVDTETGLAKFMVDVYEVQPRTVMHTEYERV